MKRLIIKGNEAFAEAAIRAGVDFFAGYPITPSSDIMEYLARRMPEVGKVFIPAENEVSASVMVFAASACGVNAMTASSGPGISLMQETLSTSYSWDMPNVIINVQRYGNGPGLVQTGQTDYYRDTRGGGQGDYRCLVLSPKSIQEGINLIYESFDLAQEIRRTVFIHTEAALGQMSEPAILPEFKEPKPRPEWALCGVPHQINIPRINAYDTGGDTMAAARREFAAWQAFKERYQRWDSDGVEDADYVFVAYGIISRPVLGAVKKLREQGYKVGMIRPISLCPYPEKAFEEVNPKVKGFLVVEGNDLGMMVDDAALSAKRALSDNAPVYCLPVSTGVPKLSMILDFFADVENKEVEKFF
jgi:2-oxoglutarate ferredoxin oxidoreductase subunit alpha